MTLQSGQANAKNLNSSVDDEALRNSRVSQCRFIAKQGSTKSQYL
jgi:hypothetical protein